MNRFNKRAVWLAGVSGIAALCASTAYAADAEADSEVDAVIVTGTRTTGLKAVDSPAPVQVLGSDVLTRTAQTDLVQAIAQNVPSFNAQAVGGDLGGIFLSARLRGLSPNHTLVLVNGKRRHGTASLAVLGGAFQGGATADLGLIPLNSVSHIEVLQDGAAAQYGTDAIAGVVNIILKDATEGGSISASAGKYFDGGGDTADFNANIGLAPIENSYLNVSYLTKWHDHSFRGDVDPRLLNTPFNTTSTSRLSRYPQVANAANYPYLNEAGTEPAYRLNLVSYNAGYEFSDTLKLYSFGTYGDKYGSAPQNYRVANLTVGLDGSIPKPMGYEPSEVIKETDYAFTLGLEGEEAGWHFDLATTYGKDHVNVYTLNSFNNLLYKDTSTATTPGFSPIDFYDGAFIASQWSTQLDLSREFEVGMATPLSVAVGGEYREDMYQIASGDPASYYKDGAQSFPGFSLTDASKNKRTNYGVYIDLAVSPIEAWKVDVAARHEHFSDFGNTTVFKLTSRYDFSDMIAVRGTVSTGFRAPTLAEEYYSATNVSPTSATVQLPPNSFAATALGINGLRPEKSTNYSVGFVAHPGMGITATLDAYQIEVRDRIVGSGTLYATGGVPLIPAAITALRLAGKSLDPSVTQTGVALFTNGLDTRTRGAELVLTMPSDFGDWGNVQWTVTGNYNKTKITKIRPQPAQLAGATLFSPTALTNITDTSPKYRVVLGGLWTWGDFSVNLKESFYGSSSAQQSRSGAVYYLVKIKPAAITDIEVAYKVTPNAKVSVGARNLFNYYPDEGNALLRDDYFRNNSNSYVAKYPAFSPYGIQGGYYYGRINLTF